MPNLKFATTSCRLADKDGVTYPIAENQAWDADDPLVLRHPGFFSDEPLAVAHSVPTAEDLAARAVGHQPRVVEAATAAPGEQRRHPQGIGGRFVKKSAS